MSEGVKETFFLRILVSRMRRDEGFGFEDIRGGNLYFPEPQYLEAHSITSIQPPELYRQGCRFQHLLTFSLIIACALRYLGKAAHQALTVIPTNH